MKNKVNMKMVSIFLAVSVILGGAVIYYSDRAVQYERYLRHMNDKAFSDIITSINSVSTSLNKLQYASDGPYMNTLAANVWREAMGAKAALSLLPLSDVDMDETQKFISQSGAYAYSLLQRGTDEETKSNIAALSDRALELTDKLWNVKMQLNSGAINYDNLRSDDDAAQGDMSSGISDIETEFPEMGTLIYDGPYSDHIEQMEPLFLQGKPEVTPDVALGNARIFAGNDTLKHAGETGGKIPAYIFASDDGTAVHVTKKGGYIVSMNKDSDGKEGNILPSESVNIAQKFLDRNGYRNMVESYYQVFDNNCTINFAYSKDGIKVYPDLIKVEVNLESGEVIGFEGTGYIMSHRDRNLKRPAIALAQAQESLDDDFTVVDSAMAIVPTSGKNEVFCYEFHCRTDYGQDILVYIDAQSGELENMLVLIEDENGTLTM